MLNAGVMGISLKRESLGISRSLGGIESASTVNISGRRLRSSACGTRRLKSGTHGSKHDHAKRGQESTNRDHIGTNKEAG